MKTVLLVLSLVAASYAFGGLPSPTGFISATTKVAQGALNAGTAIAGSTMDMAQSVAGEVPVLGSALSTARGVGQTATGAANAAISTVNFGLNGYALLNNPWVQWLINIFNSVYATVSSFF